MTLYLFKVYLQTFLSIPITQKCQILSCDTLIANERHVVQLTAETAVLTYKAAHNCTAAENRWSRTCSVLGPASQAL